MSGSLEQETKDLWCQCTSQRNSRRRLHHPADLRSEALNVSKVSIHLSPSRHQSTPCKQGLHTPWEAVCPVCHCCSCGSAPGNVAWLRLPSGWGCLWNRSLCLWNSAHCTWRRVRKLVGQFISLSLLEPLLTKTLELSSLVLRSFHQLSLPLTCCCALCKVGDERR